MVESVSDRELVERAQAGDRVAYGQLVERFSERLRVLVRSRLGPGLRETVDPEDVVQETFYRALEGIERFEWRGEDSFMRWLGSIAENVVRKAARRAARTDEAREVLEIPADTDSPGRRLRREERRERLERALGALPPDHREVLRLTRIEGLTTREVAVRMGRSQGAVKQLAFRALRRLRESFGDTESFRLPPGGAPAKTGGAEPAAEAEVSNEPVGADDAEGHERPEDPKDVEGKS